MGRNQGMHLNTSSFLFRHQHSALLPRVQPQTSSRSRVNRNLSICPPSAPSRPWLQSHTLCLTEQEGTERKMGVSPIPHLISPRNLCLDYFSSSYFSKDPYLLQLPEFCKYNRQFLLCLLISLLSETKRLHKFSCRTTPHTVLREQLCVPLAVFGTSAAQQGS